MANHFHLDLAAHSVLSTMASGANRTWFTDKTATVIPSDARYQDFVKRTDALGAPVVVLHRPEDMARIPSEEGADATARSSDLISKLPAAYQVPAGSISYEPNQLTFNVQCPADGWLLVTDRWSRNWRATVNGLSVPVLAGDFIFRAIPVRVGENKIQFSYHPFAWWELLLLSWSTLFIAFAGPRLMRFSNRAPRAQS